MSVNAAVDTADVKRARMQYERRVRRVLTPPWGVEYKHLAFAVNLVVKHGIEAYIALTPESAYALPLKRPQEIYVPWCASDVNLAAITHEIGHCVDEPNEHHREDGRPTLESEVTAWRFAIRTLGRLRWSEECQSFMKNCLRGYCRSHVTDANRDAQLLQAVVDEGRQALSRTVRIR